MDHIGGALHLTAGALASTFLGLSVLKLQAETAMRFKIPFDFYVGETKLPAGAYTLEHADSLLRVWGHCGHAATVLSNGAILPAAIEQPELMFHRYATDYFLSEVKWTESWAAHPAARPSSPHIPSHGPGSKHNAACDMPTPRERRQGLDPGKPAKSFSHPPS